MLIKSQVKYIQSLSQKKLRDAEGVFVAEGPKIINELLNAGNVTVQQLFATESWAAAHMHLSGHIITVTDSELQRVSFLQTPNQVTGIFSKPVFHGRQSEQSLVLMLDTIQDPGNMGSIIRCADWFGITQVICSESSADVFNPKVVQSTMASICRVQVQYTGLPEWLQQHPEREVYAATLEGTSIYELQPGTSAVLVIGNEAKGIDPALLEYCKHRVTIPRKGQAESLNAAVATGIILSHFTR